MEIKKSFKEIREGEYFIFEMLIYIKTSKDRGLSLAGSRVFNLQEVVKGIGVVKNDKNT